MKNKIILTSILLPSIFIGISSTNTFKYNEPEETVIDEGLKVKDLDLQIDHQTNNFIGLKGTATKPDYTTEWTTTDETGAVTGSGTTNNYMIKIADEQFADPEVTLPDMGLFLVQSEEATEFQGGYFGNVVGHAGRLKKKDFALDTEYEFTFELFALSSALTATDTPFNEDVEGGDDDSNLEFLTELTSKMTDQQWSSTEMYPDGKFTVTFTNDTHDASED